MISACDWPRLSHMACTSLMREQSQQKKRWSTIMPSCLIPLSPAGSHIYHKLYQVQCDRDNWWPFPPIVQHIGTTDELGPVEYILIRKVIRTQMSNASICINTYMTMPLTWFQSNMSLPPLLLVVCSYNWWGHTWWCHLSTCTFSLSALSESTRTS